MATVGQALTAPEVGWRRYEDNDSRFVYAGVWSTETSSSDSGGSSHYSTDTTNGKVTFKFYGSKLRIIGDLYNNKTTTGSVSIDGTSVGTFSEYLSSSNIQSALVFEIQNLSLSTHVVNINFSDNQLLIDAIDIDSTGYLVHPILNQVSSITRMNIGDCISCRYTASTSGATGTFLGLGTCLDAEIPIAGTTTPSGLFYFIKVDKGLLIADRVIQNSITWDTLNTNKLIEGVANTLGLSPISLSSNKTDNTGYEVSRLIDGDAISSYWQPNIGTGFPIIATMDFGSAMSYIIKGYQIISTNNDTIARSPKSWTFEGSNDGTTWNVLDTQTGIAWTSTSTIKNFPINNTTLYRYYRINITANGGNTTYMNIGDLLLYSNVFLIRSLSGGCSYSDASGNSNTADQSKGGWPTNNEWDTYVVNSNLNKNITPGSDNIWHWSNTTSSWCKDTPINAIVASSNRISRGATSVIKLTTATSSTTAGFRPALKYIEPDGSSKETTLWN